MSTWQNKFRSELEARGYSLITADHDPRYGWCLVFSDGARDLSFEAPTTVAVSRKINNLPRQKTNA